MRHAAADAPPSDAQRRPVSMNALATSLRLPFESVRRRIHNLSAAGLCQVSAEGVVVPTAILASPEYLTLAFAGYERIRAFHRELVSLGALRDLPPPTVDLGDGMALVRAVARLVTDYVLRAVDGAQTAFGDVITCLVLLEVFRGNTEHLGRGAEPEDQLGADGALDDRHRRPVKAAQLARRLGLPAETVRRYAAAMVERGSLVRTPAGLVAPAEGLLRGHVITFVADNERHLRRLFTGLSQLGGAGDLGEARPRVRGRDAGRHGRARCGPGWNHEGREGHERHDIDLPLLRSSRRKPGSRLRMGWNHGLPGRWPAGSARSGFGTTEYTDPGRLARCGPVLEPQKSTEGHRRGEPAEVGEG
ncbi:helix-turn-helix domain-containing protein [Phenylobacterium sp. J367]|uniref:helix-turn-helix domain-containing protein n=1 Tax=Phenylobacterium sp. J367 TaxID=2898435 RepID=UPI00215120A5|nr:helix-turn-helix domain-containing protein [Phenylobacterium sp. J367]MCR5879147.1 helix-turn-helix domain-containing protein [Phenylobacterium sp. J367]